MARELNPAVALQVFVVDGEELAAHSLALLSSPRDLASVAGPKAARSAFQGTSMLTCSLQPYQPQGRSPRLQGYLISVVVGSC